MAERAPRHHALVDFPQHQQRLWAVLEEDHEKVEKRSAELEGLLRECLAEFGGDYTSLTERIEAVLASQQQAEPTSAKSSLVAATPSEDGREVPVVVGYLTRWRDRPDGGIRIGRTEAAPILELLRDDYPSALIDSVEPMMTVAQHERIVGAYRVALIQARSETPVMIDAQPARQVGGDERETAIAQFALTLPMTSESAAGGNTYDQELRRYYLLGWDDRAALAPAAVVMPERRTDLNYPTQLWREAAGWNAALDQVARLNRRAIPAGLVDVLISTIEGVVHDDRVPNEVSQECASVLLNARALLGKDGETRKCKDYGHGGHWCGAPDCWLRP